MLCSTSPAVAQIANLSQLTHDYINGKFKGYSTVQLDAVDDSFLSAGTYYSDDPNFSDHGIIHVMKMGPQGYLNYTNVYPEMATLLPDYRVVAAVGGLDDANNKEKFVVSQVRGNSDISTLDEISVLHLDADGQIIQSARITSNSIFNGSTYINAYPLGALYYNEGLYICGYLTNNSTDYPNNPDWGPKDT